MTKKTPSRLETIHDLFESIKSVEGAYSTAGLLRQLKVNPVLERAATELSDNPTCKELNDWLAKFREQYPVNWPHSDNDTKGRDMSRAGLKNLTASQRLALANAEMNRKMLEGKSC